MRATSRGRSAGRVPAGFPCIGAYLRISGQTGRRKRFVTWDRHAMVLTAPVPSAVYERFVVVTCVAIGANETKTRPVESPDQHRANRDQMVE